MFTYVYILENKNNDLYTGVSDRLRERLQEHNGGKTYSTKNKGPWKIIFYEAYLDKKDAMRREKYLKTSQGSRLLKRMLKEYFYAKKS